jgi:hypothetical protein
MGSRFDYEDDCSTPFELVPVHRTGSDPLPAEDRARILIHTVHDGGWIPERFRLGDDGVPRVPPEVLHGAFVRERDWGANLVARALAEELGLEGYARVNVARVLLDFNRFPGTTPRGARDPLGRLAINPPLSDVLPHPMKMQVLELYDRISDALEPLLRDKLIVFGVHTYDELNPSLTSRPHLSIVSQSVHYQRAARMPEGVFDPLYPDVLGESSCSRILRDRISLDLERGGFRVAANHPYALPAGSVEIRSQVWYFFSYVRMRFEEAFPSTQSNPVYLSVWSMLLNTNLRQAQSESLRGYLHRYRKPDGVDRGLFEAAEIGYRKIGSFLQDGSIVRDYRRSVDRPSSLGLEVRKDLLCEPSTEPHGHPMPATEMMHQRARVIAEVVGGDIRTFLREDRGEPARRSEVLPGA